MITLRNLLASVSFLICLLALPCEFARADWTLMNHQGVLVTRSFSANEIVIEVKQNGATIARIVMPSSRLEEGLELKVVFSGGVAVEYPVHYLPGVTPFTRINGPQGLQLVPLGISATVNAHALLTQYGYLSILQGKILVFASGFVVVNNSGGATAVFPYGSNSGSPPTVFGPNLQEYLLKFQKAFASNLGTGTVLSPITVTNYVGSTISSSQELSVASNQSVSVATSSNDFDAANRASAGEMKCEKLPPCCCEEHELNEAGECKKALIYVPGAGGGISALSTGSSASTPWDGKECHKNTYVFNYDPSDDPKEISRSLTRFSNRVAQGCGVGSKITLEGFCYGGALIWAAMDRLDNEFFKWRIKFWNTPFKGGAGSLPWVANLVSFGIVNLVLSHGQLSVLYNSLPSGPSRLPADMTAEINIGDTDFYVSTDSQRGPLTGPGVTERHFNAGHFDTSAQHRDFEGCCGNMKVEDGEECEGTGSECRAIGPGGGVMLDGWCDSKCKCKLTLCGDGVVQSDPPHSEECEKPGDVCRKFQIDMPDGGCAIGGYQCTADCKCPPAPSSRCAMQQPTQTPALPVQSGDLNMQLQ